MTSPPFVGARAGFRARYGAALEEHAASPGEATLNRAYELGREAVSAELAIVDVADVHNDVLREAVTSGRFVSAEQLLAAGDFLIESLSAFEMVHRGYRDVREQAERERRRAHMLERLSSLLSDESLMTSDSFTEALQLVAEQARELTGAARCVLTTEAGGRAVAVAASADDVGERPFDGNDAPPVHEPRDGSDRLLVPLRSLGGAELGALEATASAGAALTARDEHVLVQIAEMASAAIERAQLYRPLHP